MLWAGERPFELKISPASPSFPFPSKREQRQQETDGTAPTRTFRFIEKSMQMYGVQNERRMIPLAQGENRVKTYQGDRTPS